MSLTDFYSSQLIHREAEWPDELVSAWKSPSNIALVKYWGKRGRQLPMNASVSMTLSSCTTDMEVRLLHKKKATDPEITSFLFEDEEHLEFEARIQRFLNSVQSFCPFLREYDIQIQSQNSFPHSAGIASSASAYSALALCLTSLEDRIYNNLADDADFRQKASFLARLGSGSACRSIFAGAAWWGESEWCPGSTDECAVSYMAHLHDNFRELHDAVLVLSSAGKPISSSRGHELMDHHLYRNVRIKQCHSHLQQIHDAMTTGDLQKWGDIIEAEALTLHGLMMSSTPGYILMTGPSIEVIQAARHFRKETGIPLYFTLDAGPNVHLLYPGEFHPQVHEWICNELNHLFEDVIFDRMGNGPVEL